MDALRTVNLRNPSTPQTERADKRQKRNNAGGYSFVASDATRFRRFLITGTNGGTYYVSENKLTKDAVKFVVDYIADNGVAAVNEAVKVSDQALAPSNNQALFVIAVALNSDDADTKRAAKEAVIKVARTGTHLFTLCEYLKNTGGWGSAKTKAIAAWYTTRDDEALSYQVAKYRQRDGWTHRDVLRLAHPKGISKDISRFILSGEVTETAPVILRDFERLSTVDSADEAVEAIRDAEVVAWEFLPTGVLKDKKVWRELADGGHLPLGAMIRNISRLGKNGAFEDNFHEGKLQVISGDEFTDIVVNALTNEKKIKRSRIHPMDFLKTIAVVGDGSEGVPHEVIGALHTGYEMSFVNVKDIDASALIGMDVSGSMSVLVNDPRGGWSYGDQKGLTCAKAGASLIQVIMEAMRKTRVMAFSSQFQELSITKQMSLNEVHRKVQGLNFGSTDCALPMQYALNKGLEVDAFFVITDSETWYGNQHPFEALKEYRNKVNPKARLFVIALSGTEFTIADPDDPLSYDIAGFDSSMMKIVEESFNS